VAPVRERAVIQSLFGFLRYVFLEFGTLIVFWVVLYTAGIKPAIAAIVIFILLDWAYRRWRKIPVTRIYILTSALAVAFGCVDLLAANPFMIKYEAVVTNAATGIFFVAGARGEKSLIQEVAEKRNTFPDRADIRQFFRLFTLFWAAYFFVKAGVYLWLGMILPLERALALRTMLGGISLAGMFAISFFLGRPLFFLCRRLGLLPVVETDPAASASS
jgi:intracellular septation protein A